MRAMMKPQEKHNAQLPTSRGIRRACNRELYRTIKRLNVYVSPERLKEAETFYFGKVIEHLLWIHEHRSNKRRQVDWWAETCAPHIASLWEVDEGALIRAFRDGYGG